MALKRVVVRVEARHIWRVPLEIDDTILDPLALAAEAVMTMKSDPRIIDEGDEEVEGQYSSSAESYPKPIKGWFTATEILEDSGHEPADYMIFDPNETGLKCLDCNFFFGEVQGWHPDFICLECGSANIGPAVKP